MNQTTFIDLLDLEIDEVVAVNPSHITKIEPGGGEKLKLNGERSVRSVVHLVGAVTMKAAETPDEIKELTRRSSDGRAS